jgi:N-acyl-L-homoserine lactone synthetase
MFAARKRLFVDLLKRDLPILAGRFVVDDRDGPEATYVIVVDGAGGHCASARITPLTGPDPIRDTVDRSVQPAAQPSDIVEIAHLCLAPELSAGERRIARALLFRRLAEFVRANGVRHVVGHASEPQVRRLEARGWPCRRIDGPAPDGKRSLAAIAVDVDGMTLSKLAAIGAVAPGRAAGRAR